METRTEHDLLGFLEVPVNAYYGIHSLRAQTNFDLSGQHLYPEMIKGLAEVKKACAIANAQIGRLDEKIADAIGKACDEIIDGGFMDQFITDPFQGGAGTSANMNVNEVVANRAIELLGGKKGEYTKVHPLDHVNLAQSTNDAVPTAIRITAIRLLDQAAEAIANLKAAFQAKEKEFSEILKLGRTEMQDAVPITLGQEFAAWAKAAGRDERRLRDAAKSLYDVNLGGTAIGTGLNAHPEYVACVVGVLSEIAGLPLVQAEDIIDATQNCDAFAEASGLIKSAAVNLAKIAADLRLMSSGPRGGFGEISLPPLQAGSSIMPGKVNPVATEVASQCAFQIMGNDVAITIAAAGGQLELNAFLPMISHNLFESIRLLSGAATLLADKCVSGIIANEDKCLVHIENSFALLTALSPHIGYEAASALACEATESGKTIRCVALEKGLFTEKQLDNILCPLEMTRPGIAGENSSGRS